MKVILNSETPVSPWRRIILYIIIAAIVCVAAGRLYNLQIVNGESYLIKSERRVSKTVTIEAPRGEIVDRYGRPLVTIRMSFSICFDATSWDKTKKDSVIGDLIVMCGAAGQEYVDTLAVSASPEFQYTYTPGASSSGEKAINEYISENKWDKSVTAGELIALMCEKYDISTELSSQRRRAIAGICFEMEQRGFSKSVPYTFAEDVDITLVTKLKELSRTLPGVDIAVEPIREYRTSFAAHILGRVGLIYKDEYAALKEKGYAMNDRVGKDGIEKAYEDYLRGVDGSQSVEMNSGGRILNVLSQQNPILGKNCVLTLDIRVQEAAEKSLAAIVPKLRAEGKTNTRWGGGDSKGAALVAIDVKNGGLIACASYPTFDLKNFNTDYAELSKDSLKPMLNRAISGAYPPGSTFKMITALSALESGAIATRTKILDRGIYTYYGPSYSPMCDVYKTYHRTHGSVNVSEALKVSCTYFFYEAGRLTGIENMASLARKFGLGAPTGIEIGGESRGRVASKEQREAEGNTWYKGDTISAAIGQSDTLVTPIQLANYIATLVNGGTLYKTHLLKSVKDSATNLTDYEYVPEALGSVEVEKKNIDAVIRGMEMAAQTEGGTAYSVFKDYPVDVGAKTGSAQAPGGSHAVFVAFAPSDNPEIAVAIVVENGGQGSRIASVARDVFDAYFNSDYAMEERMPEAQLLS